MSTQSAPPACSSLHLRVPVRSGDATFPKAMDNVTVRQGESATLRSLRSHCESQAVDKNTMERMSQGLTAVHSPQVLARHPAGYPWLRGAWTDGPMEGGSWKHTEFVEEPKAKMGKLKTQPTMGQKE
ncbi:Opioid-binding protein/cell adhesion molecule [Fukomys damarensis]|uniref:Opioid-binding protein/cell adhesion molecule n=1 Tax=Fukomys damarensis TaxID=885580 RepID=A0A091E3P5_FUKDA|nr:Opioid-binding protein/cell adhesion molecule [Fukomys damarensis]